MYKIRDRGVSGRFTVVMAQHATEAIATVNGGVKA